MTLLRPFGRPAAPLATFATALVVGASGVALGLGSSGVKLSGDRVGAAALAFAAATGAVVVVAARFVGRRTPRVQHAAVGVVSATVVAWEVVDAIHFRVFARHVDQAALALGWQAVRSGTLRVGFADILAFAGSVLVAALALSSLHAGLSWVSCSARAAAGFRAANLAVVALGIFGALFRDRLFDERHAEARAFYSALPWSPNGSFEARGDPKIRMGLGSDQDTRTFAGLAGARREIGTRPLAVTSKPNLLIVHVESLRWDMLTPALMPRLTALSHECWAARHHYSTGNNTGSSVFGLVTGLAGFFYVDARAHRAPALPLVVLHRLGYRNFVHFANNLAGYDDVYDVVFRGAIDQPYTAKESTSDRMDLDVVDHYLGSLDPATGPRFDYLVLDSTHYDYAYPPEFERHTPSGTLDLGVRDAIIFEPGINDRLRPRAPLVKNRYMNAVEWVDTVIGRIADGLRAKGAWATTWVAIVGDHGEAFWEHGTFGHGGALEDEQIRVPLVLCGSPAPSGSYEYTSHADIFPTWFDAMGLRGAPGPFMSGHSLLTYRPDTDVAVTSMGVSGKFVSRRYVASGLGLKVSFDDDATLSVVSVADASDRALSPIPGLAYTVLARAVGTKLLRSPTD